MKYQPMWKPAGGWVLTEQLDLALEPGLFLFLPEAYLDGSPVVSGAGEPVTAQLQGSVLVAPVPPSDRRLENLRIRWLENYRGVGEVGGGQQ